MVKNLIQLKIRMQKINQLITYVITVMSFRSVELLELREGEVISTAKIIQKNEFYNYNLE